MKILDKTISQLTVPTPFAVGDAHVYLIKGDTLSLVDAGVKTSQAKEALTVQLKELGYFPNDIEQIILTHHHPDHIGLIEMFPRAQTIAAHKNVDAWLQRNESFFQRYEQFFQDFFVACGIPERYQGFLNKLRTPLVYAGEGELTSVLKEGDGLPGHEEWQVMETKGHAQSHLSFLRQSDGVFIGGDHLLAHISPNPLLEAPHDEDSDRPKPLLQFRSNLKKCLSLDISIVYPGHGNYFANVDEVISVQLERQEQRAKKVLEILKERAQTPFDICQQLFPEKFEKQLDLTMSETVGQLDFLEDQGLVERIIDEGIVWYHVNR